MVLIVAPPKLPEGLLVFPFPLEGVLAQLVEELAQLVELMEKLGEHMA
jgi:hypothetical protein